MAWAEPRPLTGGRVGWVALWKNPTTGKRESEWLGEVGEAAARAWAKQATVDLEGRRGKAVALSLAQVLDRYLAHQRLRGLRKASVDFLEGRLAPMLDALGRMAPVAALAPDHLRAFLAAHRDAWEPRTEQMHVAAARSLIRFAAENRIALPDFARGVKARRVVLKDAPHYTADEMRRLLEEAHGTSVEIGVALGLLAGLDYGTMRALDVAEVDLRTGWIRSTRAKTPQPVRVKIVPQLAAVLRRRMPKKGLACAGMPKDRENASRALRRVQKAAGVASGGWHRLRHSYGTALGESGADLATIGFLMGHAPGSPMTRRYVHSTEERAAAASRKMGKAIKRAGG